MSELVLIELANERCGNMDALCPAIYQTNRDTYIIHGKATKLPNGEVSVEISSELFHKAIENVK